MRTHLRRVAASPVLLVRGVCITDLGSSLTTLCCGFLSLSALVIVARILASRSSALWDLSAFRQASLVRGTAEALCSVLMPPGTRSIAVVGNGPLKPEQRDDIQGCDKVVRFNALNNRWVRASMSLAMLAAPSRAAFAPHATRPALLTLRNARYGMSQSDCRFCLAEGSHVCRLKSCKADASTFRSSATVNLCA